MVHCRLPSFAVSIAGFIAAVHAYAHTPMQETVTRGIYRVSRNPMYLFFDTGALGCCVASASLWLLLVTVLFIVVTHRVILGEERYCEETYGRSYLQTKGKARVWRNDQEKTDTRHERKSPVKNLDISILFFIFIQSISKQFRYTDRKPIEQKAIMKKNANDKSSSRNREVSANGHNSHYRFCAQVCRNGRSSRR